MNFLGLVTFLAVLLFGSVSSAPIGDVSIVIVTETVLVTVTVEDVNLLPTSTEIVPDVPSTPTITFSSVLAEPETLNVVETVTQIQPDSAVVQQFVQEESTAVISQAAFEPLAITTQAPQNQVVVPEPVTVTVPALEPVPTPEPVPAPAPEPIPAPAPAPAPQQTSPQPVNRLSESFSGDGTYYDVGLGACGITNSNEEFVAAINSPQYGVYANPNSAEVCGRCALVNGPNNTSVKVKIVDRCPECASGSLDLSPSAFQQLSPFSAGRISITWSFVSC
ncbi:Papain inhibitor [Zancudomyces culisetae]|uniref:Papain inhibitor n=1 Tax=Zancudomyces culisetae TaxID=1213189 RepID=A0A1R1PS98_ZANCU|nr:Papain inhibitor [Zancudomyces culisetae]|eukprot:OMH83762.1 Papain inhibitor [Zancudomyces culisetae]